jgi:gamma-glutamyltranspeptidase/glutathione hydrolase
MVDTWAIALARFGTMSFAQILQPAIDLAENGFPMYDQLHNIIAEKARLYTESYASSGEVFLPNGRVPEVGEVFRNPDIARALRLMCDAEAEASVRGRIAGIEAARDVFYKGEIAERIIDFISSTPALDATGVERTALLSYEDMAEWHAAVEEPLTVNYRGLDVHKCSSWTQGPVFLQQLTILEGFDLASMGATSAEYIHTVIETAKLAFADREVYYGDPAIDDVPFDVLLSKEYAARRRELIGDQASLELRPGDVGYGVPEWATFDVREDNRQALGRMDRSTADSPLGNSQPGDTTQCDAIDREGNMVSATPSGGWIQSSPVIRGLGFPLGTRGQMFYLNSRRPNALAGHKRPRATLTPTLATRNGEPYLAFGTPGGDGQDQWTLQFLLNHVDFGMSIQEAVDGWHFDISHTPSSFYPRKANPGRVALDVRIPEEVVEELKQRGHIVAISPYEGLKMMAVRIDPEKGVISGGVASNPTTAYAAAW